MGSQVPDPTILSLGGRDDRERVDYTTVRNPTKEKEELMRPLRDSREQHGTCSG